MIITDLMEYVGLKVRVYFEDNMKSEKSGKKGKTILRTNSFAEFCFCSSS